MKKCTGCGQEKPLTEFYRLSSQKSGLNPRCKACVNERNRQWAADNAERTKAIHRQAARRNGSVRRKIDGASRRAAHYRRTYGLTAEEAAVFEARLYGECDGCGQKETMRHGQPEPHLAVDHDHATGKVRGLLCFACNHAIGYAKDNPELLRRLAEYIENPPHALGGTPIKYRTFTRGERTIELRPKTGFTQSTETRAKIAEKATGRRSPFRGVPRTPEVKAKISAAHTGAKRSEEARANMRAARLRYLANQEQFTS